MNVCYLSPAVAPTVFRETHLGTQMLKLIVDLFKLWQQCWCVLYFFYVVQAGDVYKSSSTCLWLQKAHK